LLPHRWVDTIYKTFFKPMGIPYGKTLAPSAEHVQRIVAADPKHLSASDFLLPAPYARHTPSLNITLVGPPSSCFGFAGSARSPWGSTLPFYNAAMQVQPLSLHLVVLLMPHLLLHHSTMQVCKV
jgi:hypothetical protein